VTQDMDIEDGTAKKEDAEAPLNAREEWEEFLKTALIAVVLALAIRTFFLEPFNIPSGSMKPTLEIGDYLFVYKPAYGYSRYSFPFGLAPIDGRIWTDGKLPKRGDIIVFRLPTDTSVDYIKRIVGLPGDTVQVKEGRLYINGEKAERKFLSLKDIDSEAGGTVQVTDYLETLPGGVEHHIYEVSDNARLDNTDEFRVPKGHYFCMGDNRDNSSDSRVKGEGGHRAPVGYVPLENIVGRASFIFFSTNGTANVAEIWKWPWTIRYGRLFHTIPAGAAATAAQ
jgi:signal peptidase I